MFPFDEKANPLKNSEDLAFVPNAGTDAKVRYWIRNVRIFRLIMILLSFDSPLYKTCPHTMSMRVLVRVEVYPIY